MDKKYIKMRNAADQDFITQEAERILKEKGKKVNKNDADRPHGRRQARHGKSG